MGDIVSEQCVDQMWVLWQTGAQAGAASDRNVWCVGCGVDGMKGVDCGLFERR
jgi:hypothetical protein